MIIYVLILKDFISVYVWKDMFLNYYEFVDCKVIVFDWIVICIVEKKCYFNGLFFIVGGEELWLLLVNRKSIC